MTSSEVLNGDSVIAAPPDLGSASLGGGRRWLPPSSSTLPWAAVFFWLRRFRTPNKPRTNPACPSNGSRTDPKRTPRGPRADPVRTPNGPRVEPIYCETPLLCMYLCMLGAALIYTCFDTCSTGILRYCGNILYRCNTCKKNALSKFARSDDFTNTMPSSAAYTPARS